MDIYVYVLMYSLSRMDSTMLIKRVESDEFENDSKKMRVLKIKKLKKKKKKKAKE